MFLAFLGWWYGAGWQLQVSNLRERLLRTADSYSFGLLARTLFSPFRQISAGSVEGPLGVQLRAWLDRLVSRFIGAGVRIVVMIAGGIVLAVVFAAGVMQIVVWPLIPVLPFVGAGLWMSGWVPWAN